MVGNVAVCVRTWAMEMPLPLTMVPPAGALVHVTAGAFDTVQVKSEEGTVDCRTMSVVPPLHSVGVLFVVAPAFGIALILNV